MIHGFFNGAAGWTVPWVRALVFLPNISRRWEPVDFLIDTGCTATTLHPIDAAYRVGIDTAQLRDPNRWTNAQSTTGIGGPSNNFPVPAVYAFRDDSGNRETIEGDIFIAQLTASTQGLPSLLGWDVLRHFELTTNLPERRITLRRIV